ncbi:MAG: hypothetical protein AAGF66_21220 [Cyanobacteria bacterium P01_H01_bin.119]
MIRTAIATLKTINQWCVENGMPLFFDWEDMNFSSEYRIDVNGAGWDFSFKHWTGPQPGYPTIWIKHLPSDSSAKFGVHQGLSKPLL